MDKPKIISVRRPEEESEVPPEREPGEEPQQAQGGQTLQEPQATPELQPQATETAGEEPQVQPTQPAEPKPEEKPARPGKKDVGPDGLTDLERSVLDEMRERGEIDDEEEKAIIGEAKARNAGLPQPPVPPTAAAEPQPRPVGPIEAAAETRKPAGGMEVASEEQKPRVIAGAPPWVRTQAKPIIKQTRVAGVVVKEEGEASRQRQGEDHLAQPDAREYTPDERQAAADLARKIYERKQREKSFFYRLRKLLGLVKEEPLGGSK